MRAIRAHKKSRNSNSTSDNTFLNWHAHVMRRMTEKNTGPIGKSFAASEKQKIPGICQFVKFVKIANNLCVLVYLFHQSGTVKAPIPIFAQRERTGKGTKLYQNKSLILSKVDHTAITSCRRVMSHTHTHHVTSCPILTSFGGIKLIADPLIATKPVLLSFLCTKTPFFSCTYSHPDSVPLSHK